MVWSWVTCPPAGFKTAPPHALLFCRSHYDAAATPESARVARRQRQVRHATFEADCFAALPWSGFLSPPFTCTPA
eukprot:225101-Chlamydomonas_euryale.AAC.10